MVVATEKPIPKLFSDETLSRARSLFPHTNEGHVYFNHAASAPLSVRVVESMEAHLRERSIGAIDTYARFDAPKIEKCRGRIQQLINSESPDRIALLGNTSDPINVIASGLEWKSGDRVLMHEAEFPGNVWPYLNLKRLGVEIDVIPQSKGHPSPQLIADFITDKTKLLALSAVQFLTGYRADLESVGELCKRKHVIFAVDGIQGVGASRIDVQQMKIHALMSGAQKWQMGPHGTGWLYLTEEMQSRIQPKHVGWLAVDDPWNFFDYDQSLHPTARRFEGGTKNVPGIWGLDAALATLLEFEIDSIERHILSLTQLLIDNLRTIPGIRIITPTSQRERAGIVTIELAETLDAKSIFKQLLEQHITISLREGRLRFSPHFYNSPTEVALSVSALREAISHHTAISSRRGLSLTNTT